MALGFFRVVREVIIGDVQEGEVGRGVRGIIGADVLFAGAPDGEVEVFDTFGEGELRGEIVGFEDTLEVTFGVGGGPEGEGFVVLEFLFFFYQLGGVLVDDIR